MENETVYEMETGKYRLCKKKDGTYVLQQMYQRLISVPNLQDKITHLCEIKPSEPAFVWKDVETVMEEE